MNLVVVASMLAVASATLTVQPASFHKLANKQGGAQTFGNGAATAAAYDWATRLLYVIGTQGDMLNVIDMSNPANPTVHPYANFHQEEGFPDAIALCRDPDTILTFLVVSFEKRGTSSPAFLHIYEPLTSPLDTLGSFQRVVLDGVDPTSMAFSDDCRYLVVVTQGRPHVVGGVFEDPAPSIDIITNLNSPAPSRHKVNMRPDLAVEGGARRVFRKCEEASFEDPESSVLQDLEPLSVEIDSFDNAYITFPKNNVITRLDLSTFNTDVTGYLPLSTKYWRDLTFDCVTDSRVNLTGYPVHTFYQPLDMVSFNYGGHPYLATADGGYIMTTSEVEGCTFDESLSGIEWLMSGNTGINTDGNQDWTTIRELLNDATQLGQMRFTNIKSASDFYQPGTGAYTQLTGYGGRSMSFVKPEEAGGVRVYDSNDKMEAEFITMDQDDMAIFNADVGASSSTPSSRMDFTSPSTGPTPGAIASGLLNNTRVFVVSNSQVGGLYFFTMSTTGSGGEPAPVFHSYYRRGQSGLSWDDLYAMDGDAVGEPMVKDIQWIDSNEADMEAYIAVISSGAGAVSFYSLSWTN